MSTIFTDYASRFLAQSRLYAPYAPSRSIAANGGAAPLFFSATDIPEGLDLDDDPVGQHSIALEASRRHVIDSAYDDHDPPLQDEPLDSTSSLHLNPGLNDYKHYDDDDDDDDQNHNDSDSLLRHQLFVGQSQSTSRDEQKASSIYQDQMTPHVAPKSGSNTLSQGLLPSSSIPPILLNPHRRSRKFNDYAFAAMYLSGITVMLLVGIYVLFTTSSSTIEKVATGTVYQLFKQSAGIFTVNIIISIVLGAAWIYCLRFCVKQLVWGAVIIIPFAGLILFITALASSFTGQLRERGGPDPQDDSLTWLSIIPLISALFFTRLLYQRRQRLNKTISIIRLACDILKDNPYLMVISTGLLFSFVMFSIIWLVLFTRLFLVGHVVSNGDGNVWFVTSNAWILILFFLGCFLWTWEVLAGIQRVVISSVVAQWYFHRNNVNIDDPVEISRIAFQRATTLNFGSICLGGLIMSAVQASHGLLRILRKYTKSINISCMPPLFSACFFGLEGILDNLNSYILTHCGISGEPFCASARMTTKIFRRNLVFGLTNDMVTKMIIMIGTIVVSFATGLAGFIIATHNFASPYGYLVGLFGALIAWQVTGFYTKVMTCIVDAAFVCYTIDLDVNSNHCSMAMEAFGNDTDDQVAEV